MKSSMQCCGGKIMPWVCGLAKLGQFYLRQKGQNKVIEKFEIENGIQINTNLVQGSKSKINATVKSKYRLLLGINNSFQYQHP